MKFVILSPLSLVVVSVYSDRVANLLLQSCKLILYYDYFRCGFSDIFISSLDRAAGTCFLWR